MASAFKTKTLLLVMQLSQTLVYIRNLKSKMKDFNSDKYNFKYDLEIDSNYGVVFRPGRLELLDYLFTIDYKNVDVGIWSNLDSKLTQFIANKYFGRYLRDLLFILPTNRALYTNNNYLLQPHHPIKIPKQLNSLYNKFSGYNSTNTLVATCQPNTLAQHAKNDMIIPQFAPSSHVFDQDVGCVAMTKYLKGIVYRMKNNQLKDVRIVNNGKPLEILYNRMSNRIFSDSKYI